MAQHALPGSELACRAQEHEFSRDGEMERRGVLSYYATETMASADTVTDWIAAIRRLAASDVAAGRLLAWQEPKLVLVGNPADSVPGSQDDASRAMP